MTSSSRNTPPASYVRLFIKVDTFIIVPEMLVRSYMLIPTLQ
jgi:hypothetical protein